MAAKAEVLGVRNIGRSSTKRQRPQIARAVREWFRRGQLGSSYSTEMGRYTGGRI